MPAITSNGGGTAANVSVAENTTAVTTVAADYAGGGTLTYTILQSGDGALFNLNPTTHALSFKTAPDFEAPADGNKNNVYDVTVKASDGTNEDTQLLHVSVTNKNDNAPVIASNGGGAAAKVSVAENKTAVTTVAATDKDGNTLTYAIKAGGDGALFKLNSATHALSFKAAPDFEAPADANKDNVYDVTVQASDGAHVDTQVLHVSVTDVAGVTIVGSNKNDKIDATHTPSGQPLPTNEEDTISGGNKNDNISGLGGNDTLSGGTSKFKKGKPKGTNKLTGGDGADGFKFDTKLKKSKTKVMDFDSAEGDKVLLAKSIFHDKKLKDGDISAHDFKKLFDYTKHGTLKYDGDTVAKFAGKPDLHFDDLMLV